MSKTVHLSVLDGIVATWPLGRLSLLTVIFEIGDSVVDGVEDGVYVSASLKVGDSDFVPIYLPLLKGEDMRFIASTIPGLHIVKVRGFGRSAQFSVNVLFKGMLEDVTRLVGPERTFQIELNTQGEVSEEFGETLISQLPGHPDVSYNGSRGEIGR